MERIDYLSIARRNLIKAEKALEGNYHRKGITDEERRILVEFAEYAKYVYQLVEAQQASE